MILTRSQQKIVKKLFKAYLNRKKINFASLKAPTGSGKTLMISEFISQIFAQNIGLSIKSIFVVATVSSAKLPKQLKSKLNSYKKFHNFNDYEIEHIESPSNAKNNKIEDIKEFVLKENKVFVFGTSSFGKNTLFFQNRTLDTFLEQAKELNYQIIFIRDEAHIGQKEKISKSDLKNFDQKLKSHASFILEMTATPKQNINIIEMKTDDLASDDFFLLKEEMCKTKLIGEISNEEIIDEAIKVFKKSKKEYQSLKEVIINPAMLIQIMNQADYEKNKIKNKQFHNELNLLEDKLNQAGLKYLKYINSDPQVVNTSVPNTLEYASRLDSEIDVIIFKVGPATGWDIPRANMLLQLRNVSSESLNIQTLGRIMRNPYPNLKKHKITNKYYLWSNYQKPTREIASYKIKDQFKEEIFMHGKIEKDHFKIIEDENKYINQIQIFINSKIFLNELKDLNLEKDIFYDKSNFGQATNIDKIPNHIFLKIDNLKKEKEYEKKFKISKFKNLLLKIAFTNNFHFEIVKYVFFSFQGKLQEIKNENLSWTKSPSPYKILENAKPSQYYNLWKDNANKENTYPKLVDTSIFKNYGYELIDSEQKWKNTQYLDSKPEMAFYNKFEDAISEERKQNIKFFAKMPTLGSDVYFEYYSKSQGKISKSFMDFAIKYQNKTIMIEVKSKDNDYDPKKTKELLNAYKIYMEKYSNKNIYLALYQHDGSDNKESILSGYINNKWDDEISFKGLFDEFMK